MESIIQQGDEAEGQAPQDEICLVMQQGIARRKASERSRRGVVSKRMRRIVLLALVALSLTLLTALRYLPANPIHLPG